MDSLSIRITTPSGKVGKYPAKSHVKRVAEAARLTDGLIILPGERGAYYSNSDQPRGFRQDRYFYYLTGCNEPDCFVSYDVSSDVLTLWLPPIDLSRVFYDGRGSTTEEAVERYDIDEAKYLERRETSWLTADPLRLPLAWGERPESGMPYAIEALRPKAPRYGLIQLRPAIDKCRAVKDQDEIMLIRKANGISSAAHREILKQLRHLDHEAQAEGLYVDVCISSGAKEQAYGPIVGSGPNAGILHYQANNQAFGDRQVLLIDASCEWELYAADITRTMPLNAKNPGYWPSEEAKTIYEIVESMQDDCISMLRPGVRFVDVNWHARMMATDALMDLGILKGKRAEIVEAGTLTAFFPHGLGHHLGLEVHDFIAAPSANGEYCLVASHTASPDCASKDHPYLPNHPLDATLFRAPCRPESPALKPGNVITIEPGIYFNKFILDTFILNNPEHRKHIDLNVLERYMPVGGVRIEDDILITKKGYENLTGAVKGEQMLKVIRGEA